MGKDGLRSVDPSLKVWIGNVAEGVTKEVLEAHFGSCGQPTTVEILPRNTACVVFNTAEEVATAISTINGTDLSGQALQVDAWYKESSEKSDRIGWGKWQAGKGMGTGSVWQPQFDKFGKGGGKWDGGFGGGMGWGCKGWGGKGYGGMGGSGGGRKHVRSENAESTVWLGGIPSGVSKEEIHTNFEAAGTVKMVELMKQGAEGFVIFSSREEAQSAIAMFNGAAINGASIQVDVWTKKSA